MENNIQGLYSLCLELEQGIRNVSLSLLTHPKYTSSIKNLNARSSMSTIKQTIQLDIDEMKFQTRIDNNSNSHHMINDSNDKNNYLKYCALLFDKFNLDVKNLIRILTEEETELWLNIHNSHSLIDKYQDRSNLESSTANTDAHSKERASTKWYVLSLISCTVLSLMVAVVLGSQRVLFENGSIFTEQYTASCIYNPFAAHDVRISLGAYSTLWFTTMCVLFINVLLLFVSCCIGVKCSGLKIHEYSHVQLIALRFTWMMVDVALLVVGSIFTFMALWSAMHVFKVRTWIQYESQQTGQFVLFFDLATFFATFSNSVDMSYPPCISINPAPFILAGIVLSICTLPLQCYRTLDSAQYFVKMYDLIMQEPGHLSRSALNRNVEMLHTTINAMYDVEQSSNSNMFYPSQSVASNMQLLQASLPYELSRHTLAALSHANPKSDCTPATKNIQVQLMPREVKCVSDLVQIIRTEMKNLSESEQLDANEMKDASVDDDDTTASKALMDEFRNYSDRSDRVILGLQENIRFLRQKDAAMDHQSSNNSDSSENISPSSVRGSGTGGAYVELANKMEIDYYYNEYLSQYVDEIVDGTEGAMTVDTEHANSGETGCCVGMSTQMFSTSVFRCRLLSMLLSLVIVILLSTQYVWIFDDQYINMGKHGSITDADFNPNCQYKVAAQTNVHTSVSMIPFLCTWVCCAVSMLWYGCCLVYYILPTNDLGQKFIPGVLFPLWCCISNPNALSSSWTSPIWIHFLFGFPLFLDGILYFGNIIIAGYVIIAMSAEFKVMLMVSTLTYDGAYGLYLDFSSFFSTFTTTAMMTGPSGTTLHTPPCLSYNPVGIFKASLMLHIFNIVLQTVVLRIVYRSYMRMYANFINILQSNDMNDKAISDDDEISIQLN